jgi:putative hydrolase of the HAD superfamily
MPPRAIVFDLDDTLYRIRRFTVAGYAATSGPIAERAGRPRHEIFCRLQRMYRQGRAGRAYQQLCEELGLPDELAGEWLARHRAHRRRLRLPPTSGRVLQEMRGGGWRIGILTNGLPEIQRAKVEALDLASRVDALVYADELVPGGKPAPAVFRRMLDDLSVAPRQAVMVGDNPACDVAGGRSAGMRTIRLRRPAFPVHAGEDEADEVVGDLAEVPAVAARLLGERP